MKTSKFFFCAVVALIFTIPSFAQKSGGSALLKKEFKKEQEELKMVMNDIREAVKAGDIDKLIDFHAYGPKFTEFKNGAPRNNGEENEVFERQVFGSVTEVIKMDFNDLKVAVYGDVANVTFHSNFQLKFPDSEATVKDQITLLFLKVGKDWKIVHEHHSPLN